MNRMGEHRMVDYVLMPDERFREMVHLPGEASR